MLVDAEVDRTVWAFADLLHDDIVKLYVVLLDLNIIGLQLLVAEQVSLGLQPVFHMSAERNLFHFRLLLLLSLYLIDFVLAAAVDAEGNDEEEEEDGCSACCRVQVQLFIEVLFDNDFYRIADERHTWSDPNIEFQKRILALFRKGNDKHALLCIDVVVLVDFCGAISFNYRFVRRKPVAPSIKVNVHPHIARYVEVYHNVVVLRFLSEVRYHYARHCWVNVELVEAGVVLALLQVVFLWQVAYVLGADFLRVGVNAEPHVC